MSEFICPNCSSVNPLNLNSECNHCGYMEVIEDSKPTNLEKIIDECFFNAVNTMMLNGNSRYSLHTHHTFFKELLKDKLDLK